MIYISVPKKRLFDSQFVLDLKALLNQKWFEKILTKNLKKK